VIAPPCPSPSPSVPSDHNSESSVPRDTEIRPIFLLDPPRFMGLILVSRDITPTSPVFLQVQLRDWLRYWAIARVNPSVGWRSCESECDTDYRFFLGRLHHPRRRCQSTCRNNHCQRVSQPRHGKANGQRNGAKHRSTVTRVAHPPRNHPLHAHRRQSDAGTAGRLALRNNALGCEAELGTDRSEQRLVSRFVISPLCRLRLLARRGDPVARSFYGAY
jgi:hypothetical protein